MAEHYHVIQHSLGGRSASRQLDGQDEAVALLRRTVFERARDERARGAVVAEETDGRSVRLVIGDDYAGGALSYGVKACAGQCTELPPKTIRAEVWALSADETGIWLVSGMGPWASPDVPASRKEHAVVEEILAAHGARDDAKIIHSTCWRDEGAYAVHSWVAALCCPDVLGHWPGALPVSRRLPDAVGPPFTHAADAAPLVRDVDVLHHALRHLRFLRDNAAEESAAMSEDWKRHLSAFEPALAGLYSARHVPEIISE